MHRHTRDWHEVIDRVVERSVLQQALINVRLGPAEQDRVTVWSGSRDCGCTNRRTAPSNVLHHDRADQALAPVLDNFIAFAASASLGVNSVSELVNYARANPGKLSWSALPGIPNYAFLALLRSQKIEAVRVGYRDFSPAYQDLHQGRLHVVVAGVTNFIGHRDNGSAKILAVVNRERSDWHPRSRRCSRQFS
ncbi:MAG: hypothetical protein QOF14_5727 [Hyphomicrobiales bacterium]|jgi:hypothetical protein|nr:hypothetical protein [Hyphomicrobiales bacterium]